MFVVSPEKLLNTGSLLKTEGADGSQIPSLEWFGNRHRTPTGRLSGASRRSPVFSVVAFKNGFERECGNRFLLQLPIDSTWELTVTVLPFEVFQRLTNAWGTPKTTEVV
jgi:hypothetical protein